MPPRSRKPRPGFLDLRPREKAVDGGWGDIMKIGTHPDLGSEIDRLRLMGHISPAQKEAAVLLSKACRRADYSMDAKRRNTAAASFERGGGMNDPEALAARQGRLDEHDDYMKRAKRKWANIHTAVGDERVFSVLLDVVVHDKPILLARIPLLQAGLDALVKHWHLNDPDFRVTRGPGRIRTWRGMK